MLDAMQRHGKEPKPDKLGLIGRTHAKQSILAIGGVGKVKHKKLSGTCNGLPFVVEAAFTETERAERIVISGCNFSPSIDQPVVRMFDSLLERQMVDYGSATVVMLHITTVAPTYLDRGKSVVDFTGELEDAITECVTSVTADYCRQRKAKERDAAQEQRRIDKLSRCRPNCTLKAAVANVLDEAVSNASGGSACDFSNRDLYYAARELIQQYTNVNLKQNYFDRIVDEWEVKHGLIEGRERDPRGFAQEPHTRKRIPLGTKAVDEYEIPAHLYETILFFEKKGVLGKLEWGEIGERYDALIIAAEGYAVRAAKALLHAAQKGQRIPESPAESLCGLTNVAHLTDYRFVAGWSAAERVICQSCLTNARQEAQRRQAGKPNEGGGRLPCNEQS
jgi:hypothetical protein